MAAGQGEGAARLAQGVEFVDEDDGRGLRAGLLEQVAHARRAYADEQLDEFRTADGKEGHAGLACHGAGKQRLASACGSHQQDALGHPGSQAAVGLGVLQEVHDLLQLGLGLVHACHVLEPHPRLPLHVNLGAASADAQQTALPHPAHAPQT